MAYANPFDWVSPLFSTALLLIGTIIFPLCFWCQQYWWKESKSGKYIIKTYQLTEKDTIDISNKVVSAFQAVCAGVSGVLVCTHCADNVLHCMHTMAIGYAWFGIPYFAYDTFCMFYVYVFTRRTPNCGSMSTAKYLLKLGSQFIQFIMYSPVIFIHHMVMAHVGWVLILFYRDVLEHGDFFVGIIYMMECSTPFVSVRFILSKLNMKSSIWYAINGVVMLVTFPIFRILSVFYGAVLYAQQNNYANVFQGFMSVPLHWRIVWVAAVTPQVYWYFLMCRGLVKIFFMSHTQRQQEAKLTLEGDGDDQQLLLEATRKQDLRGRAGTTGQHDDNVNCCKGKAKPDEANYNESDEPHSIKPCCSSTNLNNSVNSQEVLFKNSKALNDESCSNKTFKNE